MAEDGQKPVEGGVKPLFPEPIQLTPCSWMECLAGHRWPPKITLAQCPGDGGPYLAFQAQNCQFCNEPVRRVSLRVDFVPSGSGPVPRCKGAKPFGESMDITLERRGHEAAASEFKNFLQKQAADAARGKVRDGKNPVGTASAGDLGGCVADGGVCNPGGVGPGPAQDPSKSGIPAQG